MTRGGRPKTRDEAERRCIATGETQPKAGLIRFVVGPGDVIVPDVAERLPGRGIWVSADPAALALAVKKNLFARGAKQKVTVPADLAEQVETLLARRVIELISLARKSGKAVAGFEKVKGWLADGHARVLFQASDGSERGKSKLWTPEGGRFFGCLTADELGLAFGRQHVIHGALAAGGLERRVVEEASKLRGLRGTYGEHIAGKDTKDV
ncbi:RNA-binding protein [Nioella sediminis]|uniref:RNA-binding protein n=1 Tax=Nioella sediminis TaxID=1912092 RepID=UPI0008FD5DA7|nr:RNA-binding protein [Nioella sediminis]TBX16318.1 50S ribosomal protein L7 [Roseovarius sp. JS7-11]